MSTDLIDKADSTPKETRKALSLRIKASAGSGDPIPGDIVWYWMTTNGVLTPFPAILVEKNRLDESKWEVNVLKRGLVAPGRTASFSDTPADCKLTLRDRTMLS